MCPPPSRADFPADVPRPPDDLPDEFWHDPVLFAYDWPSMWKPAAALFGLCIQCRHKPVRGPRANLIAHLDRKHPGWATAWYDALMKGLAQ